MTFEHGVWKESALNFWANRWVVLLTIGLVTAVSTFLNSNSGSVSVGIAWLPLAITAHATVLTGKSGYSSAISASQKAVFLPFLWRSIVISVVGVIPAMAITIPLAGVRNAGIFGITLMIFYGAFTSFIFAKWGTMLPACVIEGDKTLTAASARGSLTFKYVLARLWGFNGPLLTLGFVGLIVLLEMSKHLLGVSSSSFISSLAITACTSFLFAFNLVMLATILSRAYLIAEDIKKRAPDLASAS